ncbi:MAG: putative rane protein [Nocardioidaceae bacterium]|jgi:putative membrane protein|nr:putative rane protein [Nocardioidaceae bacterium]MDX6309054.1 putative rane protein [Nocardioidaceae bacterium]
MTSWIVRVIVNACALAVAAWLFTGISVNGASERNRVLTLVLVALIFGLVNEFVRPVVALLSLPLYLLTLGLFYFVVNALMLWLTSWLADLVGLGFRVRGFWTAVFGAIVITIVSWIIGLVLPSAGKSRAWRGTSRAWR